MADLIAFVEEETLLVDDPLFSNNAVEQYLDRTDKYSKRGSTKYLVTLTEEKDNQKQEQSRCPMCQKVHDLDACYSYKKLEVGDIETSQRAKNQWQEVVKAVKKNQLTVEEKFHVHKQPSKKMSSLCVWCQLR